MKVACEKCYKVIDVFYNNKFKKIRIDDDEIILCNECYEIFKEWLFRKREKDCTCAIQGKSHSYRITTGQIITFIVDEYGMCKLPLSAIGCLMKSVSAEPIKEGEKNEY